MASFSSCWGDTEVWRGPVVHLLHVLSSRGKRSRPLSLVLLRCAAGHLLLAHPERCTEPSGTESFQMECVAARDSRHPSALSG